MKISKKQTFEVLKDAFFGLKKGDTITFFDGEIFKDDKYVGEFDPNKESSFFLKIENIDYLYSVGQKVRLKNSFSELIVTKNSYKTSGKKIIKYVHVKNMIHPYKEDDLILYEEYWFINSKGQICPELKDKSIKTDRFRRLSDNYFDTLEAAKTKMKTILGDYYTKFNESR